jgi:heme-degrading monooxygenase HmoA
MVLEQAILNVRPGKQAAFEVAFDQAKELIAGSSGFCSLRLSRCLEDENRYLLLVEWESLAAHVEGFRNSPAYDVWRKLLHHFYDPFPLVEHFQTIVER